MNVKAVVVGAGGISNAWFPPLIEEKVHIPAVVDLNIETAQAQIKKYGLKAAASTDLEATLKEHQTLVPRPWDCGRYSSHPGSNFLPCRSFQRLS
jgi:predicted dehydrogenase